MNKVIFDLDGTLIDSRERLYRLFMNLAPKSKLSFDKYWGLKRDGVGHETILAMESFNRQSFAEFSNVWHRLIEDPSYLVYDKIFPGVHELLGKMRNTNFQIYLLTARQNEERVHEQLEQMNIHHFFKDVLVTRQKFSKEELLRDRVVEEKDELILVGDTGVDITAGKAVGAKTVAVLSGFRSKKKLLKYKPDLILSNVCDLLCEIYPTET